MYPEYTSLEAAKEAFNAALNDVIGDNPDVDPDQIAHDMIASIAMDCTAEVGWELCRTELGGVPFDVRHLRPDIAKLEDESDIVI